VNTPQFGWSRTHLPHRHRPVGAVYQPEAAAAAIVRAAQEAPRELWVGAPAVQAIAGAMVAPGVLDRYLARTAYEAQMDPESAGDDCAILDDPAPQDGGMHGRFDGIAKQKAAAMPAGSVRLLLGLSGLGIMAGALALGHRLAARRVP